MTSASSRASSSRLSSPARSAIASDASPTAAMVAYRQNRDLNRRTVLETYTILGFLSSGTYGRVYKARLRSPPPSSDKSPASSRPQTGEASEDDQSKKSSSRESVADADVFAIKKFKPDKETEVPQVFTGISQSAMREIALNRELRHENIIALREVILEDKSIYMVIDYAEHDFLQLIHHHGATLRTPIPAGVLKTLLWQLLNGVAYLHANWVLHRDLKPANILLTSNGVVKIADLGLARLYSAPLQPLYSGDKVVVTIWYRAPELLLGARHYTPAVDMWAIGCIWGELLALRPMFKGEEAKMDPKTKTVPFQTDQLTRIVEVLGSPSRDRWPTVDEMPDYKGWWHHLRLDSYPNNLHSWYNTRNRSNSGYTLFEALLRYDQAQRWTAAQALEHPWFTSEDPKPTRSAFASLPANHPPYPKRRLIQDDADPKMAATIIPPVVGANVGALPGPAAPPPAPGSATASVGSAPGQAPPGNARGGMVGTATANASAQGGARKKMKVA